MPYWGIILLIIPIAFFLIIGLIVWIIKKAAESKPQQVNNYYVGQPPYQKVDQQTFSQQNNK